jgi:hypothetical protein
MRQLSRIQVGVGVYVCQMQMLRGDDKIDAADCYDRCSHRGSGARQNDRINRLPAIGGPVAFAGAKITEASRALLCMLCIPGI